MHSPSHDTIWLNRWEGSDRENKSEIIVVSLCHTVYAFGQILKMKSLYTSEMVTPHYRTLTTANSESGFSVLKPIVISPAPPRKRTLLSRGVSNAPSSVSSFKAHVTWLTIACKLFSDSMMFGMIPPHASFIAAPSTK